jgi:hypothetical protein
MRSLLICTDLYSSPNVIRVTKSRRTRWAGHVAHTGRGEVYAGFWWGNLRERDHLVGLGVDGRVIMKLFFRSVMGGH